MRTNLPGRFLPVTGPDFSAAIVAPTEPTCTSSVFVFDDGVAPNPIGTDAVTDPDGLLDPIATAMVNEQTDSDVVAKQLTEVSFPWVFSRETS